MAWTTLRLVRLSLAITTLLFPLRFWFDPDFPALGPEDLNPQTVIVFFASLVFITGALVYTLVATWQGAEIHPAVLFGLVLFGAAFMWFGVYVGEGVYTISGAVAMMVGGFGAIPDDIPPRLPRAKRTH